MWRSSELKVGFGGKMNRIVHGDKKNLFAGLLSHVCSVLEDYHVSN